jgi:hypothetical protein
MHAQCQCGQLSAAISGTTEQIVACHCTDCQRRSGSPFGVVAYFPEAIVGSQPDSAHNAALRSGARATPKLV